MNRQKLTYLAAGLIIASILLVGAVQRFDTIIAKRIITTSSSGVQLNGAGTLSLASGGMTLASGDLTLTTGDATLTAGDLDVAAGNLSIGNGTPGVTLDGEDAYIEGTLEVDGLATFDGGTDYNAASSVLDADGDTIRTVGLNIITYTLGAAAGYIDIATGNLKIGDGTPSFTQDGEDAYVEGTLEAAGDVILTAQTTFSVVQGLPITPTGTYMPLTSSPISPDTASEIAAATTIGELLILHNVNATRPITVDGTGGLVECKADVALFPQDTLTLLWNGTDWVCLSNYDNS